LKHILIIFKVPWKIRPVDLRENRKRKGFAGEIAISFENRATPHCFPDLVVFSVGDVIFFFGRILVY